MRTLSIHSILETIISQVELICYGFPYKMIVKSDRRKSDGKRVHDIAFCVLIGKGKIKNLLS